MNELLELLRRPDYVHLLLSHVPVVGSGLALVVLCFGLIREDRTLTLTGLIMQSALAVTALLVIWTGERALETITGKVDAETSAFLEAHAMTADTWGWVYYLAALVSLAATVIGWKWPKRSWWPCVMATGFAMISLMVGFAIAHSGGKIRHPEFRPHPAPTSQSR